MPDAAHLTVVVDGDDGPVSYAVDDVRRPAATPDLVAIQTTEPVPGPFAPWPPESHGLAEGFGQLLASLGDAGQLHIVPAGGDDEDVRKRHVSLPCLLFGDPYCLVPPGREPGGEPGGGVLV